MKLKPLFLALTLLVAVPVFAQSAGDTLSGMPLSRLYNPWSSNVPIWLDFTAGANFAECFDKGTIPFRYKGIGANGKGGVTIVWSRCRIDVEGQGFYTSFTSLSGTAYNINLSTTFLYHCSRIERWSFWAGGTLQGCLDIKEIPALMNASTSISLFGHVGPTGLVQYSFAPNREKTHYWLTAFGKLNLPLVGMVNRPSYSYIGNPTLNDDNLSFLNEQETFGKFFPGMGMELGLKLNLLNSNRILLSYRWDYLSTGSKGSYRYDNALHSVNLSFMFRVN